MKTLISVSGTTGIGKTKLAIDLARHLGTEIISCDSRQFFNEMPIGTAAPSHEELNAAPHHFIGHRSVLDHYSIGQYEKEALARIEELFTNHHALILTGGSMMYEKAVITGLNDLPEADTIHQEKLSAIMQKDGITALQDLLHQLDPEYFAIVDRQNPRRLMRAIDVIWQTGKSYTQNISSQVQQRNFRVIRIGLTAPRDIIYDRINLRVEQMIQAGLLQEAEALLPHRNLPALQTVGYTELFRYMDGEWPLETAIEEIKKNSRRFAKRQLTWYRKENDIHLVNYDNALQESLSLLKDFNL